MANETDRFVIYADCRHPQNQRTGRILRRVEWADINTNTRKGLCPHCKKKQQEKLDYEKSLNGGNQNGSNDQDKILFSEENNKEITGGTNVQQIDQAV